LSTFTKGIDAPFLPQKNRSRLSPHLTVHCAFEQDRRDDVGSGESRRSHYAHTHLVHEPEHFGIAAIGIVRNAVKAQRAGRRSAALIKRGDEAVLHRNLRHHLVIGHDRHPRVGPVRSGKRIQLRLIGIERPEPAISDRIFGYALHNVHRA